MLNDIRMYQKKSADGRYDEYNEEGGLQKLGNNSNFRQSYENFATILDKILTFLGITAKADVAESNKIAKIRIELSKEALIGKLILRMEALEEQVKVLTGEE